MDSYGDFIAEVNDRSRMTPRAARFGLVSADELRNKFDRLASGIKALGLGMRAAHTLEGTIDLTTLTQWNVFELAWLDFYIANRPWDILWSSDEQWRQVELWEKDFHAWRKLYEERTAKKPPPHIELKDVPGPPEKPFKIPVPVFGPFVAPEVSAKGLGDLGLGLGLAAGAALILWARGQSKGG